ncbi:hypothetical protein BJY00DRAFT_318918 [Aspergillus carlsbadensis]|nr:hypothetical protein BJY00DRAFT_318918 [Aspergillus carlsbadensis]
MEPVPTPAETDIPEIFDPRNEEQLGTPPTPPLQAQESEKDEDKPDLKGPEPESHEPPTMSTISVSDELSFLRKRIDELEEQTLNNENDRHAELPIDGDGDTRPKLSPDEMEFKRMLACLYEHRKEYEDRGGPGFWDLQLTRNRFVRRQRRDGPWDYTYRLNSDRAYLRPDPFDPSHECNSHEASPQVSHAFDSTIDYGDRRERLRKHFEWELDRLYLAEEIDKRRLEREEEEEQKKAKLQSQERKADAGAGPSDTKDDSGPGEAEGGEPVVIEPILTRLQWHAFKRGGPGLETECQIDVLVGEPILQDDLVASYAAWYGYSGHAPRKVSQVDQTAAPAATAVGETPLPERVRIRSLILTKILAKIVGSEGNSLSELRGSPIIFIRPFKILTYCERALRDWSTALRKKYSSPPAQEEETSAEEDAAIVPEDGATAAPVSEAVDDKEQGEKKDEDEDIKSPEALRHLECLLKFVDTDITPKRSHLGDSQCRKVFFSDLWHLFRPGMEVISNNGKQVYRVVHVRSARHRVVPAWQRYHDSANSKSAKASFGFTCVYIDFDGQSLGPVSTSFEFKRFDGQRDITSLDVYPLQFYPVRQADFDEADWPKIEALSPSERASLRRQRFIERGKLFLQVAQVKHMYYAGPTVGVRDEVESQVVVDFETAFSVEDPKQQAWKPKLEVLLGKSETDDEDSSDQAGACRADCCRQYLVYDDAYIDQKQRTEYIEGLLPKGDHNDQQPSIAIIPRLLKDLRTGLDKTLAITPDELLIMSYRVFGFVLRTRKWAQLDLSYLTEVHVPRLDPAGISKSESTANAEANEPTTFSRLVLNEKHKRKGLILLLHGAPGVGKTSTAEGVAELFQKPLFQITCGDLGTTAKEVETALETNFALANRWDCILLLDEADVFLSQRTKDDFQRNGLVAVFLRVMEYYAGILFLTTNRVGDFDEAFTSRIHVSLYYPDLTDDQTAEIFKLNLGMIEERFQRKGRHIKIDHIDIIRFADRYFQEHRHGRWNGRQIRNACQTALALAEYEAQKAQGDDPQNSVKTDAPVNLTVAHFAIVSDAYLEFIDYINRLFGTNSSRRAHEDKLRAFLADANDSLVASLMDKQAAFARNTRPQQPQYPAAPGVAPPADLYYGHTQPPAAPGGYLSPNAMAPQRQPYGNNEWNPVPQGPPRGSHVAEPTYIPSQQSPQTRMQVPRSAQYLNQPVPPSFNEPEPQYTGQEVPGGLPSAGSGNAPAQDWQRAREAGGY